MNSEKIGQLFSRIHLVRIALLCTAANLLLYLFLIVPRQSNLSRLQTDHHDNKIQIRAQELELQGLGTRLKKLQQAQKDLVDIYEKLLVPKKTGVTEIRLELEELTRPLRVQRQNFRYNYGPQTPFGLQLFTLSVPIRGNYRNIREFINKIETSRHFLILDNVVLSTQKEDNALNLDFRISTYLTNREET